MACTKNLLLLADRPGWTFDRIAHQLARYAHRWCAATAAHGGDGEGGEDGDKGVRVQIAYHGAAVPREHFDAVICLWYGGASDIFDQCAHAGATTKIVCVYDVERWQRNDTWLKRAVERADYVLYACDAIRDALRAHFAAAPWLHVARKLRPCYDGVDLRHFAPQRATVPLGDALRVGWCGDARMHADDLKGLAIIRAVCARNDDWLELHVADASDARRARTYEQMPTFYAGIDVYVCMSSSEGTPNPILEACASERPFVSTDVGVVAMLLRQSDAPFGIVLGERTEAALEQALRTMYTVGRSVRAAMGAAARRTLVDNRWDWRHRVAQFRRCTDECDQ